MNKSNYMIIKANKYGPMAEFQVLIKYMERNLKGTLLGY